MGSQPCFRDGGGNHGDDAWVLKRKTPLFHDVFHLPTRTDFDARLVVGAATFGIGWGLGGFCPGPALTSLLLAASGTLFFVPAMLVGIVIAKYTAAPLPKTLAV